MPEKTEAQKRAQKAYMEKFVRVEIRMTPEQRSVVQAHADAQDESVNGFIGRAIAETMERDAEGPQEAAGAPIGTGAVSLPPETVKTAQEAAEASGETTEQFIRRAVDTQARDDIRDYLNDDRREQTVDALVWEIEDTGHLVTSTLWCNVAYNGKLYKKPKDAQRVHAALVECKQGIDAMLDNLIEKVVPPTSEGGQ